MEEDAVAGSDRGVQRDDREVHMYAPWEARISDHCFA